MQQAYPDSIFGDGQMHSWCTSVSCRLLSTSNAKGGLAPLGNMRRQRRKVTLENRLDAIESLGAGRGCLMLGFILQVKWKLSRTEKATKRGN